jgi:hypothetical protein
MKEALWFWAEEEQLIAYVIFGGLGAIVED